MGRWAQAQRAAGAVEGGRFYDFAVTNWVNVAGFWEFNWICLGDPLRWEIEVDRFINPNWIFQYIGYAGGAARSYATGYASTTVLRARIRSYIPRGFAAWGDKLQTP